MIVKNRTEFQVESGNIIDQVLLNRGVLKKDISKYLFYDSSLKANPWELANLDEGLELLLSHVERDSHIRISVDPDLDGYSSASIMYQYLTKDLGCSNVSYYIPSKKIHGINVSDTLEHNPDLLIVPDSGSSDFEEHRQLHEAGIDCLVIDHHLVEKNKVSEHAVVINNQISPEFKQKGLTGSNMVYLFCEAYDEKYQDGKGVEHYLDLSGIGSIADRAPLTDLSVYYYYMMGGKNIKNPFIKKIVENSKNIEAGSNLTAKDIGWEIAPLVNAATREGREEEIKLIVDALFGLDYQVYNSRLKKEYSVVEEGLRKAKNVRSRQNKKVKEAMEALEQRIEEKGTADNQVLLVNSTGIIEDSGLNGLVATKLAQNYGRPTLVMQYNEKNQTLSGSGRNINNSPIKDFRQELENSGKVNFASGHSSAFGVSIDLQEAADIIEVLNEQLSHIKYENLTYHVDRTYISQPDPEEILQVAQHDFLWGTAIEAPLVHVEKIKLHKNNISFIGKQGNVWKLDMGTCEGIMFGLTEEQKLSLVNHDADYLLVDIVGECGINTFNGQKRPQIQIKDFNVEEYREDEDNPWSNFDVTSDLPF